MQETRNNCFGSKKSSTTLRQAKTGKHECRNVTATCQGRATFFRPETIIESFQSAIIFKVIFNHTSKRQFVVLLFRISTKWPKQVIKESFEIIIKASRIFFKFTIYIKLQKKRKMHSITISNQYSERKYALCLKMKVTVKKNLHTPALNYSHFILLLT